MSRPRTILHTSPEVTQLQNVAGYRSPLLAITTPDGVQYNYETPLELYLQLFDTDGNQIPAQSDLIIGKQSTDEELPRYLRKIPYSPYYDLNESQQRDSRFIRSVRHEFGRGVNVVQNPEGHLFLVEIDAPVQVDLSNTRTRFELTVQETN